MYERMEMVSRTLEWLGIRHRSNYQPMLDRLAGYRPAEPLRILADACEGLGLGPRAHAKQYTSLVPLNRLADAARPESESVRHLEQAVEKKDWALLRLRFIEWAGNDRRFEPLATDDVLLGELTLLSRNLSVLGTIGLRAIEFLESGQAAPAAWASEQRKALQAMQKPSAELSLAAVRPVQRLVDALAPQKLQKKRTSR
jgi:hexosaminidase